jgi:hypothetical protein
MGVDPAADRAEHPGGSPGGPAAGVDVDLVEYLVIAISELTSAVHVGEALRTLVRSDDIRVLDLVAVVTTDDGGHLVIELEGVPGMAVLRDVEGEVGGILSEDDIAMACTALPPATTAVILVVEDRWAEALSGAARLSGGRVVGGERIPRHRIEASIEALRASAGDDRLGSRGGHEHENEHGEGRA